MVDPRDLFPGAYVMYELLGWEVTGVTEEGIRLFWRSRRKALTADPREVMGIPIGPNLMEKLGWHRDPVPNGIRYNETEGPNSWVVKFWFDRAEISGHIFEAGEITFGKYTWEDRKIKDIHELQQQYRWATGKHLEIKL